MALTLTVLAFIGFQLYSFFFGTRSKSRQRERDIKEIERQMNLYREALIPFGMDDFKLLSAQPVIKTRRRSMGQIYSGVLSSIYQEAIFAFSMIEKPETQNSILMVQSLDNKFLLEKEGQITSVTCDGNLIGQIDADDKFIDGKNKVLAEVKENLKNNYYEIHVLDKPVAYVNAFIEKPASESDRLFSLFHEFQAEQDDAFIALCMYMVFFKVVNSPAQSIS